MASIPIPNLPAAISLTGMEEIPAVQSGVAVRITINQIIADFGGGGGGVVPTKLQGYSTNSSTSASLSLSSSDISGGYVEHTLNLTGAITNPSNAQLPTATGLATALNATAGQTYKLRVINSGGANWTLVTNTGWTLNGSLTIYPSSFIDYYVTIVSGSTAGMQSV